jgi:RHS repeat-associated protein
MPFGEDLGAGQFGRTTAQGYEPSGTPSNPREKFATYERDDETGLDFAQARYYQSKLGRFTGVDPYNIILERQNATDKEERKKVEKQFVVYLDNPQRWNRYHYSLNNPLLYTDPNGEDVTIYYRQAGPGGASANDFGHVLIYVRNDKTGEAAYFDYYPDKGLTVIGNVNQERINQHASFTIETNSSQEQAILDAIKDFQNNPLDYSAQRGTQCSTMCSKLLSAGNLGVGGFTPVALWESAFERYAPEKLIKENIPIEHGMKSAITRAPYQEGKELGRDPRGQARIQDKNARNANVKTFYKNGKVVEPE